MERKALKLELEELAMRFSEGWHEGIKIDALDIVLLNEAAEALAQPAQEPVDWEQIYWDMVNAMLRDKLRTQPAQEPVGKVTEVTANGFKCEFNKRLTAGTKLYTAPPQCKPLMLNRYDAGLLNDFGGGNVDWWWDYLRAELDRAHDFYQTQAAHGIKD